MPVPPALVYVGQEDKLTTGLQSCCREGSRKRDAWSALKAVNGFRGVPTATGFKQTLATRVCHAYSPNHANPSKSTSAAEAVTWREGLRALYCRMLARSISDCLFNPNQTVHAASGALEHETVSAQHARAIPPSWMQFPEWSGQTQVARTKAAIADRFGVINLATAKESARRPQGHSLIFSKAA